MSLLFNINTYAVLMVEKCLTKSITIPTILMKNGGEDILVVEVAIVCLKKI